MDDEKQADYPRVIYESGCISENTVKARRLRTRALLHEAPQWLHDLAERLADR